MSADNQTREHLYRKHAPAITCHRCHVTFKNKEDRNAHQSLNKKDMCELVPAPTNTNTITLDKTQYSLLKDKRQNNLSEEERCKNIFRILFPGETDIPSLYMKDHQPELAEGLADLRKNLSTELKHILLHKWKPPQGIQLPISTLQKELIVDSIFSSGHIEQAINNVTNGAKRRRIDIAGAHPSKSKCKARGARNEERGQTASRIVKHNGATKPVPVSGELEPSRTTNLTASLDPVEIDPSTIPPQPQPTFQGMGWPFFNVEDTPGLSQFGNLFHASRPQYLQHTPTLWKDTDEFNEPHLAPTRGHKEAKSHSEDLLPIYLQSDVLFDFNAEQEYSYQADF